MTAKLSERLRELEGNLSEAGMNIDGPSMSMLSECIAQAEAQEAQAGELSDERDPVSIALARNNAALIEWRGEQLKSSAPNTLTDDEIDRVVDELGLGSRGRASFRAGLRYARDHYLRPSQATGHFYGQPIAGDQPCDKTGSPLPPPSGITFAQAIGEPVAWHGPDEFPPDPIPEGHMLIGYSTRKAKDEDYHLRQLACYAPKGPWTDWYGRVPNPSWWAIIPIPEKDDARRHMPSRPHISPEARDKAIKALENVRRAVNDHRPPQCAPDFYVGKQLDQALSALRSEPGARP